MEFITSSRRTTRIGHLTRTIRRRSKLTSLRTDYRTLERCRTQSVASTSTLRQSPRRSVDGGVTELAPPARQARPSTAGLHASGIRLVVCRGSSGKILELLFGPPMGNAGIAPRSRCRAPGIDRFVVARQPWRDGASESRRGRRARGLKGHGLKCCRIIGNSRRIRYRYYLSQCARRPRAGVPQRKHEVCPDLLPGEKGDRADLGRHP
jgi:hypothetical protein